MNEKNLLKTGQEVRWSKILIEIKRNGQYFVRETERNQFRY